MCSYSKDIKVSIGIFAHNEEESIKHTLTSVIESAENLNINFEIIVILSGCTDNTAFEVKKFNSKINNYTIIIESERKGKAASINAFRRSARGDVLVLSDADVILDSMALKRLYDVFQKNTTIGLTYARMKVLRGKSKIWSKIGEKSAQALDAYRCLPKGQGLWMVCGYLYAMKAKDYDFLPDNIVTDDVYFGLSFNEKGVMIKYIRDAIVYVSYPQNLIDYVSQKFRNRLARRQLKSVTNDCIKPPAQWLGIDLLRKGGLGNIKHLPILILDVLMLIAVEIAWIFKLKQNPRWRIIKSSKLNSTFLKGNDR